MQSSFQLSLNDLKFSYNLVMLYILYIFLLCLVVHV